MCKELEHPDDPVHRCADLMAHRGQEGRLRLGRLFRHIPGDTQRLVVGVYLRGIDEITNQVDTSVRHGVWRNQCMDPTQASLTERAEIREACLLIDRIEGEEIVEYRKIFRMDASMKSPFPQDVAPLEELRNLHAEEGRQVTRNEGQPPDAVRVANKREHHDRDALGDFPESLLCDA